MTNQGPEVSAVVTVNGLARAFLGLSISERKHARRIGMAIKPGFVPCKWKENAARRDAGRVTVGGMGNIMKDGINMRSKALNEGRVDLSKDCGGIQNVS
jgi:hypothetical protein